MKKKIIAVFSFIIILVVASSVLFNKTEKKKLIKVRVADTTITSWTYRIISTTYKVNI